MTPDENYSLYILLLNIANPDYLDDVLVFKSQEELEEYLEEQYNLGMVGVVNSPYVIRIDKRELKEVLVKTTKVGFEYV